MKILSKVRTQNLKNTLPFLIFSHQFVCIDKRLIRKSCTHISDLLEIGHILKLMGLLATIDIEQRDIEKYGFGNRFIKWLKILVKN